MAENMIVRKKYVCIIIILIFPLYWSLFYKPNTMENTKENLSKLTREINGWTFLNDVKLDYQKYIDLDPDTLIFRNYIDKDKNIVNMVVVYHQNNRWGAHNPTVCYRSQGWKIEGVNTLRTINLSDLEITVNQIIAKKNNMHNLVYYLWFSSNKKVTHSRNRQMFNMVTNGLIHGYTESGFVRLSIQKQQIDENAKIILDKYLKSFYPSLIKAL